MLKNCFEYFEYGLIGMIAGAVAGGVYFNVDIVTAFLGAFIGGISFSMIIGTYANHSSIEGKLKAKYGTAGLLVGMIIGGADLKPLGYWGNIVLAIACSLFYFFLVGKVIYLQHEKGRYLTFKGDGLIIVFTAILGTLNAIILWNKTGLLDSHVILGSTLGIFFTLLFSLLFSAPLGFVLAGNFSRPILGSILTFISGNLVLWIGLDIAPILFMPGSGLYWSGLVIGLLLCGIAILVASYPSWHISLGIAIIILSLLSFIGAAGGLIIGGILGMMGGIFTIAWNGIPETEAQQIIQTEQH